VATVPAPGTVGDGETAGSGVARTSSAAGHGDASNGVASNGAVGNGVASNGAARSESTSSGAASNGAVSNGAVSNGAVSNGAVSNGAASGEKAGVTKGAPDVSADGSDVAPHVGRLNYILISTALGGSHSDKSDRSSALTKQPRTETEKALLELVAPLPSPPRLRIMLVGKPVSGKGTQAALISRKYGLPHISLGDMLRAEMTSGTELGKKVDAKVRGGELLPDDLVMSILKRRLAQDDCMRSGYILDGFPRTASQAEAMEQEGVTVDVILLLDRSDEDALFWSRGRASDPKTGIIYHTVLNPPPDEAVAGRLIRRSDDDLSVAARRMKDFSNSFDGVYGRWSDVLVRIDTSNCRTIMSAFEDVCEALDAMCPEGEQTNWHAFGSGREPAPSATSQAVIEAKEAQLEEFIVERTKTAGRLVLPRGAMLSAVKQCCGYRLLEAQTEDPGKYLPFIVDGQRLGFVGRVFATHLMQDNADLGVFAVQLESCALDGWTQLPGSVVASPELLAMDVPERTDRIGQLMERLHARGLVQGWRDELHPISQFFQTETLFEMERACLPYFGLRGYGIHVNGYVRRDGQLFVWVATRSRNKATYAGLFDQMVAGGLPSGVSLIENVAKEAVEEAGVDLADLDNLTSVGSLSYRYVGCFRVGWGVAGRRRQAGSWRRQSEGAWGTLAGWPVKPRAGWFFAGLALWCCPYLLVRWFLLDPLLVRLHRCAAACVHGLCCSPQQVRDKKGAQRQVPLPLRPRAPPVVYAHQPRRGGGGV